MNFIQYLNEAKDQLDISIISADKWLTSEKKKIELLNTPVVVEQKSDGVKLTLIYKDTTGDYTKDWIVSYKGEIQYSSEFNFLSDNAIKKSSIANAQFKLVFDHLKKITPTLKGIKKDTEFFVEYLMTKPTLSSNYKRKHGMVLIASSKTTYIEKMGKLKSNPIEFDTKSRDKYAKILKLNVPSVLFKGVMNSEQNFKNGIKNKKLNSIFTSNKSINWNDNDNIIMNIKEMFLEVESFFGGIEEGVVISYQDGSRILKFQQSYQVNQEARAKIKMKYKEDNPDNEQNYWNNVRLTALNIINRVTKNRKITIQDFPDVLSSVGKELKSEKLTFSHSKKNKFQIMDDIQGNLKFILRKNLKDNNNFLFLGKFRVLTKAHYDIIKEGLRKYDNGVVCVVTSKDTKFSKDLRNEMVRKAFPNIEIVNHSTGNLFSIMNKASSNINVVLAGSDRVQSYKEMLKFNPDLSVQETKRTDSDISATKVIANIDDEQYFKENTPKEIHSMYDEIRKTYEI